MKKTTVKPAPKTDQTMRLIPEVLTDLVGRQLSGIERVDDNYIRLIFDGGLKIKIQSISAIDISTAFVTTARWSRDVSLT